MSHKHHKKRYKSKLSKHHCYTKKIRCNKTDEKYYQIKLIDDIAHQKWHYLCRDMSPKQAVRFIARNFMPTEIEDKLLKAIQ